MPLAVKQGRGLSRIAVTESASVRDVGLLHAALLEAAGRQRGVIIDLTAATQCDAAFAQLLVAARRTFDGLSLRCEVHDPGGIVPDAFPCTDRRGPKLLGD